MSKRIGTIKAILVDPTARTDAHRCAAPNDNRRGHARYIYPWFPTCNHAYV
jgi:hypothetical protein